MTTQADLEGIMLSEISHTEKNKYLMISLTCRIVNRHTHTHTPDLKDTENRFVVARGAGVSKTGKWGQKVQFQLQSKHYGGIIHSMVIIRNNTVFHI